MCPYDIDTLNYKGIAQYELKQYPQALETFEKAIKVDGKNPDALNNKAIILAKMRCCDVFVYDALKMCKKATRLDKKHHELWSDNGAAYYFLEKYKPAAEAFKKSTELYPSCPYAWSMRGLSHFKLGEYKPEEYKKAYKCFLEALKLDPYNTEALNLKGITLYRLNEPTKAKEAFEKAKLIKPEDQLTLNNLGWLLFNFGNLDEALLQIEELEEYCNTEDTREISREYDRYARQISWGWCLKGQILIKKLKYSEAIKSFEQAIKWDNTFPIYTLWHTYARYLKAEFNYGKEKQKYKEELAVKYQEEIASIISDLEKVKSYENNAVQAYVLYFLGVYYCKAQNYFRAKDKLKECIDLKPGKDSRLKTKGRLIQNITSLMPRNSSMKVQPCARKLLGEIWIYQIKPSWWQWWLYHPLNGIWNIILFTIIVSIFIIIILLSIVYSDENNINQYLMIEVIILFILFSPSISRIKAKDIEIETQSPAFSSIEFYPEMPPFDLEDSRPIKDLRKKLLEDIPEKMAETRLYRKSSINNPKQL
ncbi:tetratricopeptide repeat protein [Methanosarcina sp. T3]|uniref:tetratricopeptide repeat protein n=1 Tax=Methanosarcina sp. T3 TaxID=3439062 RepID=UPI003F843A61